jgi:hypothetical protein
LVQISSTGGVSSASAALRAQFRPCHRKTFLTTCWLMVEAPRPLPSASAARIAFMSNPQCRQKLASSAATTERAMTGAISSQPTQSRSMPPSRQLSCI